MALAHTSRHWSRGSPCSSKPLCLLLAPEMPQRGQQGLFCYQFPVESPDLEGTNIFFQARSLRGCGLRCGRTEVKSILLYLLVGLVIPEG